MGAQCSTIAAVMAIQAAGVERAARSARSWPDASTAALNLGTSMPWCARMCATHSAAAAAGSMLCKQARPFIMLHDSCITDTFLHRSQGISYAWETCRHTNTPSAGFNDQMQLCHHKVIKHRSKGQTGPSSWWLYQPKNNMLVQTTHQSLRCFQAGSCRHAD